jgi:hypothetical protein
MITNIDTKETVLTQKLAIIDEFSRESKLERDLRARSLPNKISMIQVSQHPSASRDKVPLRKDWVQLERQTEHI